MILRHTDGYRQRQRRLGEIFFHHGDADTVQRILSSSQRQATEQQHKLFTTITCGKIDFPYRQPQQLRQFHQHLITDTVTMLIVNLFKVVNIDKGQHKGQPFTICQSPLFFQRTQQITAVV